MGEAIRVAVPSDARAIAAIYAPFVSDTVVSFEIEPPTPEAMAERIAKTQLTHPWLVAEQGGRVVGYAYSGKHRDRAAYRWSVDVTVYVAPDKHRTGLGRSLYGRLLKILKAQNFRSAFAGITLPNNASVGLHEALGFKPVGIYRGVGFKRGQWQEVGWWRLALSDAPGEPGEPIPFSVLEINL
jgi:phosphinothricin acetyltransferase